MKGSTNASARPNIRIQDASAEFVANTDTSTNAEFPYRASVSITGVTHYMSATVIYSQAQCISGAYATYCQTYDGGVYLYAKTNVGTQTIPAISCDISVNYINVENVPTSGSQSVITSGGVYDNCVRVDGTQNITGSKIFNNIINTQDLTKNIADARASDEWVVDGIEFFDSARRTGFIRQKFQTNNRNDFTIASEDAQGGIGAIHIMSDGYVTATSRSFNSANTGDVMTIGHLTPVDLTSQVTADPNQGTFNTTYSTVTRSGNVVVITIGGSNIGSGLSDSYYLYNVPKAFKNAYAGIYDVAKQKLLGYLQIRAGEKIVRATTYDSGVSNSITMELVYLTNE